MTDFNKFLSVFKSEKPGGAPVDLSLLLKFIEVDLGVPIPKGLLEFWSQCGAGYFGERDIYFFGTSPDLSRDSIIEWNSKNFWADVYPEPAHGGPVFFAENSFGEQLGFRWENGKCLIILFIVDTFESFVVSESIDELFESVLTDRYALVEPERLCEVEINLGKLPSGKHYAPILSPMLGGTGGASNFAIETPSVHFRTAIATFKAIQNTGRGN